MLTNKNIILVWNEGKGVYEVTEPTEWIGVESTDGNEFHEPQGSNVNPEWRSDKYDDYNTVMKGSTGEIIRIWHGDGRYIDYYDDGKLTVRQDTETSTFENF